MTAPHDRSMTAELLEGTVDGTYKRVLMDRSNYPSPDLGATRALRLDLNSGGNGYGVFEAPEKRTPDNRFARDQGRVGEDTYHELRHEERRSR